MPASWIIPIALLIAAAAFIFARRLEGLLAVYLIAVPVLPQIPVGTIQLSILDILAVPAVLYLIYCLLSGGFRIQGGFAIGLSLYTLAAVISWLGYVIQNGHFNAALFLRLIRLMEMLLPVLLTACIAKKNLKIKTSGAFLIGGGLAAATGLFMYFNGIVIRDMQSLQIARELVFRAGGTHGDSGSFGNLMAINNVLAVWVLLYFNQESRSAVTTKMKTIAAVSGLLSLGGLVVSLSRAGLFATAIGAGILLLPFLRYPGRIIKATVWVFLIIAVFLIILVPLFESDLLHGTIEAFGERILGVSDLASEFDRVSSGRTANWQDSWNIFKRTPAAWLFGLGYKSLIIDHNIPPDNNYLQAFFEMGVPGALAVLAMVIFGLQTSFAARRWDQRYGMVVLALWVGYVFSMASGDYLTCWHNVPGFFVLLTILSRRTDDG